VVGIIAVLAGALVFKK